VEGSAIDQEQETPAPTALFGRRKGSDEPVGPNGGLLLLRQSGVYFVGRTVPAAITFAALALYTRLLTPEQYGLYAVVNSSVVIASYTGLLWLYVSAIRLFEAAVDRLALRAALLVAYLGAVAIAGLACLAGYALLGRPDYRTLIVLGFALFAVQGWLELNLHLMIAALEPDRYLRLSAARAVGSTAIGTSLAFAGWGASGVLMGAIAGGLLPGMWLLWAEWRFNPLRRLDRALLRDTLSYGLPLSVSFSFGGVLQNADRLLLGWLATPAALGAYAVAFDLVDRLLKALMDPIASAGLPLAVRALERAGEGAARRQLRANLLLLTALGLPATLGLAIVSPGLCRLILGPDFQNAAAPLVSIIAVATLLALTRATYLDHAFHLGRRTLLHGVVMLGSAVTSIAVNLWLIPIFGASGAAYAAVVAHSVGLGLAIVLGRSSFPLPFPLGELLKLGAASAVMCLVLFAMPDGRSLGIFVVRIITGALAYGVVAFLLNAGNVRDRVFVRGRSQKKDR
jgi:O-antigen/teichoic acid export membrane protein